MEMLFQFLKGDLLVDWDTVVHDMQVVLIEVDDSATF